MRRVDPEGRRGRPAGLDPRGVGLDLFGGRLARRRFDWPEPEREPDPPPTHVYDAYPATPEERRAHFRESFKMTLITLAIGLLLFASFFGLVAACDRL